MIDYLIIGSGLAGISFSEIALQNGKSILVCGNGGSHSDAQHFAGELVNFFASGIKPTSPEFIAALNK